MGGGERETGTETKRDRKKERGWEYMHITVHLWRSGDNFWELALALHRVGLRDQTQASKTGSRHPYLLSHLTDS